MIGRLVMMFVAVALIVAGISIYLSPDDLTDCQEIQEAGKCRVADAIVVVSGGDTLARTDEAIRLFKEQWAPFIIFSGAAADKAGPSNAKAMQLHAIEQGVPEGATIIEELSETTKQNAEQVKRYLDARGITDIILVTSGYHMRRAGLEFSRQFDGVIEMRRHPVSQDAQWSDVWWLTPWGWWTALGELAKIGLFYAGGSR